MAIKTKYRLALSLLLPAALLLVARNLLAQPPAESLMGTYPLPKIVGMSGETKTAHNPRRCIMAVKAYKFDLKCPRCGKQINRITEIVFLSDWTMIVDGQCCGIEITSTRDSGERRNVLAEIPLPPDAIHYH